MLRKRPMNRSRLLMCTAALVAAACQDRQSPPAAPSFLIQDAAHNGGNPHFYWLPPMTRQPSFTGTFDGTLAPVVEISELGSVAGCADRGVTPVAGQDVTVLTTAQTAGLFIPAGALAEQVIVLIESRTDRPCIPLGNMALPQFPDCYRYEVNPTAPIERLAPRQVIEGEIHNSYRFQTDVIVGMCVEVGNLTPGQQARLDLFRFDPVAGTVNTLPDAPARFLPCDPNFGVPLPPPVGAAGALQRGWRVVMNGLRVLVGARTAYASTAVVHVGLGGSSCCTSYFTWGLPGVLSPNLPDTVFVAPVGATVVTPVVVKDSGGSPMAGALVTFAAASGTIIGANPVTTGPEGIAQVSWQLPSTPGLSTLTASTPGAAESPRHFLATGTVPIQVDAGGLDSCALNVSGQAFCWGRNDVGQLGDGTTTQRLVATAV